MDLLDFINELHNEVHRVTAYSRNYNPEIIIVLHPAMVEKIASHYLAAYNSQYLKDFRFMGHRVVRSLDIGEKEFIVSEQYARS